MIRNRESSPSLLDTSVPEQGAVREQMERMIAHPLFSHSKRYSSFFRYVVEEALTNKSQHLKERTIGAEVFGREPGYDTSTDPVVRVTAGDIRRRIAQYYYEAGHESELRIELPAGSYVPEIRLPDPAPVVIPGPALETARHPKGLRSNTLLTLIALAAICVGIGSFVLRASTKPSIVDQFWGPLAKSGRPVLIVVSGGCPRSADPGLRLTKFQPLSPTAGLAESAPQQPCNGVEGRLYFQDAVTLSTVAGLLRSDGTPYEIRQAPSVSFSDMRSRPAVLIGGFNNGWTMRLCSTMPYEFKFDGGADLWEIVDSKSPSTGHWGVLSRRELPPEKMTQDYALISRLVDPTTEQMLVVAAGIGAYGTVAAGEFLSNPRYMQTLLAKAPRDWSNKNFQLVIGTDVINGNSGPPKIIASQYW